MLDKIKIGYVGLGRRGTDVLRDCFSKMKDVEIKMLCEQYVPFLEAASKLVEENSGKKPILTQDFNDVINDPEIDAIVIMTGWEGRAALAMKSMKAGKYTAIEVGGAFDLKECYDLVDTYENTGSPLMMLENCCYNRPEMMALNMVKQGLFGEIVHCDGGYMHYLAETELFNRADGDNPHYRIRSYAQRNCENYPTHELGPIAKVLSINRGNRMLTLSSVASKAAGLKDYTKKTFGDDSPFSKIDYKQGDIVTTIIKCANGETIHLCLDTTIPRPYYSRNFTVRGTRGGYVEERHSVYLEGMEEPIENNEEEMFEKYDHPLQKEYCALGTAGGHGGMDWLVCRAFVESVKRGVNTPIDAYDTATWMAITPLSEMSIQMGGAPVAIPDFTKGKWINREPVVEGKYCLDKVCVDEETKIYSE